MIQIGAKRASGQLRGFSERRQIIYRTLLETDDDVLKDEFSISDPEVHFYRLCATKGVDQIARKHGDFSAYYALRTAQPFLWVAIPALVTAATALVLGSAVYSLVDDPTKVAPVLAACVSVAALAVGWIFVGWNTHRNTVRQNTNALLLARYAYQPFSEALERFHARFGHDKDQQLIRLDDLQALRTSTEQDERKTAAALVYLLNYYEFIASGVVRGDLDKRVVRDNIRGHIIFYHDKCRPMIREVQRANPHAYEHLCRMRAHFEEV